MRFQWFAHHKMVIRKLYTFTFYKWSWLSFKWNASSDARAIWCCAHCTANKDQLSSDCERGNAFTKCFIMYLVQRVQRVHWTMNLIKQSFWTVLPRVCTYIHCCLVRRCTTKGITYGSFSDDPQTAELSFSLLSINRNQHVALHA